MNTSLSNSQAAIDSTNNEIALLEANAVELREDLAYFDAEGASAASQSTRTEIERIDALIDELKEDVVFFTDNLNS